ncbi:hypothetical protein B0H13DRAFT_1916292 [Mycena leptocephala]|nr:hypothetical protein B0H13DRAFT_1916292 [Mycena leptocephala]
MPKTTKMKHSTEYASSLSLKRKEVVESPYSVKTTPTPVQKPPFWVQPQKGCTTEICKIDYLHLISPPTPVIEVELFMAVLCNCQPQGNRKLRKLRVDCDSRRCKTAIPAASPEAYYGGSDREN